MARPQSFPRFPFFARGAALLACAVALPLTSMPARAMGTASVTQADGSVDTYRNVEIKIIHNSLFVTSGDGKGTMVINRAACVYQGEILACLPTSVALVQAGTTKELDVTTGTIYANLTDARQPLQLSSIRLPPHSILFSFRTKRGTYINLSGVIDKVVK